MEFTQQALDQLVAYTRHPNIEEEIGSYLHYIQYWGWPAEIPGRPGYFQDEFGAVSYTHLSFRTGGILPD